MPNISGETAINLLDFWLASEIYRDGCTCKKLDEMCDHCRPVIELRQILAAFCGKNNWKMWWEGTDGR